MNTHTELFHQFECNDCEYKTTTEKGLNIHKGAKHKKGFDLHAVNKTSTCDK